MQAAQLTVSTSCQSQARRRLGEGEGLNAETLEVQKNAFEKDRQEKRDKKERNYREDIAWRVGKGHWEG